MLRLTLVPMTGALAVCKLPHDVAIPEWAVGGSFFSVTPHPAMSCLSFAINMRFPKAFDANQAGVAFGSAGRSSSHSWVFSLRWSALWLEPP